MRMLIFVAAILLNLSAYAQPGDSQMSKISKPLTGNWVKVIDKAAFSPRDTAEDVVYDGKMWLSNGYYHGGKLTRDLWNSQDGVTWHLVNPDTPYDGYSEMVEYRNKILDCEGLS